MPLIPYPPEDKIAPECQAILDAFQRTYGRPSHIFRLRFKGVRVIFATGQEDTPLRIKLISPYIQSGVANYLLSILLQKEPTLLILS